MASVVTKASTCALGVRLGLQASAAELQASLKPTDYVYGQPSAEQWQLMRRGLQKLGATPAGPQPSTIPSGAVGFGAQTLQGGTAPVAATKPACSLATSVDDLFNNHLAMELDDDCLRILLGEDEDESVPCTSGGSGKGAAGSGASQKSSATADDGGAAGGAEAASHEDDDIAMLFGELRHASGSSLEPLDLHLLGTAPLAATDDSEGDTSSQAGGSGDDSEVLAAAADAGAGLKRPKQSQWGDCVSSPTCGLMLSMNYEKAAESINLELLATGRKNCPVPYSEGVDAMLLPLLSPIMDFAAIDTPESPDSLASGCHAVAPLPNLVLNRQDSTSKRKRAVRQ